MPPSIERQTLIALKARRTASRVVNDIQHRDKLKASDLACVRCGNILDEWLRDGTPRLCPRCTRRERVARAGEEHFRSWPHYFRYIIGKYPPFKPLVQLGWLTAMLIAGIVLLLKASR